jgi:ankyrin repeat protein
MTHALIAHGCMVNVHLTSGLTPLSHVVRKRNLKIIDLLLSAGADPNKQGATEDGYNALEEALIGMEDDCDPR